MLEALPQASAQIAGEETHCCTSYETMEPPAKRARTSKSPEPTCTPSASFQPPPSSSAITIPTSSEQAVADSLLSTRADEDGSGAGADADAAVDDGREAPEPEAQATSPPPPSSDFDDLDWAWLDKGDELEKAQTPSLARDKGKGKATAVLSADLRFGPSSRPPRSPQHTAPQDTPSRPAQIPQQVFFQTASHKKISVSDNAMKEARKRLKAWEAEEESSSPDTSAIVASTAAASSKPSPFKTPTVVSARIVPPLTRPASSLRDAPQTPAPPRFGTPSPAPAFTSANTPIPDRTSALRRPLTVIDSPAQLASAAHASTGSASTTASPTKSTKLEPFKTPRPAAAAPLRRGTRPRFSTPFKKPARSSIDAENAGTAEAATTPINAQPQRIYPAQSRVKPPQAITPAATKSTPAHKPVFDLSPPQQERARMSAYGIVPESVSATQAQALGAPSEIFVILKHPDLARHYVFDDASMPNQSLGPAAALQMLRDAAGPGSAAYSEECLNLRWVQNHWGLILWKLAALVRHKPAEVCRLWTWTEMCRQLRYRYEREINRAERSAVKRIQEHDASASASMVLCVRSVLPGAPFWSQEASEGPSNKTSSLSAEPASYTLELTDGWYRIRASVDAALGRAIERKRIKVGVKLAIRGARLHSSNEGTNVLDALEKSGLSLTGNSTSLARWDTRLGFSPHNFTASLRSLCADGGCVACMNVVLTKVHPRGYVDANGGSSGSTSNARSEAEEKEAADRWQTAYEEAQAAVQAEMEAKAERWEEVKELVDEWAERLCPDAEKAVSRALQGDEAVERLIHRLLSEGDPRQVLKQAATDDSPPLSSLIGPVRALVYQRAESERSDAVHAAQQRVAILCPPRRVRSFQVIRFRDAMDETVLSATSKLLKSKRTTQLTVWDAAELNEETQLVEGARYEVTNLYPIFKSSWKGADAAADSYLSTRRNTTWRRIL